MITLFSAGIFLAALGALVVRRPFLFVLIFIAIFSLAHRFASVVYLDAWGPARSDNLLRDVGGGHAAVPLLLADLVYFGAFLIVFRLKRLRSLARAADALGSRRPDRDDRIAAGLVFGVSLLYVVLLYADFIRIGVVPVFSGLERYEYTAVYGGRWHAVLMNYGILWTFVLGVFYTYGLFLKHRPDYRFLVLLMAAFFYLFLAGHRFSAFYAYGTAFFSPYGIVFLWMRHGDGPPVTVRQRLRRSGVLIGAGVCVIAIVTIAAALYQSYFVTRDTGLGDPTAGLTDRVLVQPGELWWATWDRVFVRHIHRPAEVFDRLFRHPIVEGKNSTLPYLMVAEIGDEAYRQLDQGSAFGGGYPEVFFELLGPVAGFAGVFVNALVTAALFALVVRAFLDRRYIRILLAWYVLYAFLNVALGGMLNFLVNPIFWLKVTALLGWMAVERDRERLLAAAAFVHHP